MTKRTSRSLSQIKRVRDFVSSWGAYHRLINVGKCPSETAFLGVFSYQLRRLGFCGPGLRETSALDLMRCSQIRTYAA
jgi:hypothetical protein